MNRLKKMLCIMSCIVLLGSAASFPAADAAENGAVINEVCAKNTTYAAPDGNYYDWIELYNPASSELDISGYGLSDNTAEPFRYTFPDGTSIPAGGRIIVFCDSGIVQTEGMLSAPFGLAKEGETLTLTSPDETVCDAVTFGLLEANVTYGRCPDGSNTLAYMDMTPDAANTEQSVSEIDIEEPVLSQQSGFYDSSFQLSVSSKSGYTIRYTLDGSEPTADSAIYSSPISVNDISSQQNVLSARTDIAAPSKWGTISAPKNPVDKAFIIRAAAFDENGNRSDVVTGSYFIGYGARDSYYKNFKVFSLVTDSDNLFDSEKGIYVLGDVYNQWLNGPEYDSSLAEWAVPANYTQKGAEWEREASMEIFENGTLAASQNVGIRIHGGATRSMPQKSFNIYARSEYGASKLEFDMFSGNLNASDGTAIDEFDSFMLRNAGNDAQYSRFRDRLNQTLVSDRNLTVQAMEPCIVFINGEYWGQYDITEKLSDDFISSHYDVKKKDVCIIKNEELEEGDESGLTDFEALHSWINETDLSTDENYAQLCEKVDMQSFADYMTSEIYFSNQDWGGNNMALWKSLSVDSSNPYADGKWRFILFDTEYSVNLYGMNSASTNSFNNVIQGESFLSDLYRAAMKNESFRKQFCLTFMDMANENFDSQRIQQLINEFSSTYHDSTIDTFNRFWPDWPGGNFAESNLSKEIDSIKTFYNSRFSSITSSLKTSNSLSGSLASVTLKNDNSKGRLKINTITPNLSNGSWEGQYYTDYPVTVTAQPEIGYKLAYFETSDGERYYTSTAEIPFSSAVTITAVYEESKDIAGDINADGEVNVTDAVLMCNYLLNSGELSADEAGRADICKDNVIDIFDYTALRKILSK